jgi:hypothetical protein
MRSSSAWVGAALLLASVGFGGCSPYSTYCVDAMDCEGGNDNDIDACEISLKAEADHADVWGCTDDWDRYWECIEAEAHCDNDNWTSDDHCNNEGSDLNDCTH